MPAVGASASSLLGQQRTSATRPALTHPHSQTPPRHPSRWPHPAPGLGLTPRLLAPSALPGPTHPGAAFLHGPAAPPCQAQGPGRREPSSPARSRLPPPASCPWAPPRRPSPHRPRPRGAAPPPVGERKVPGTRCRARRPPLPPQQALSSSPGLAAATAGRPRAPQPPLPSPPPPPTSLGSPPFASFLGPGCSNQRAGTEADAGCHFD